MGDFVIKKRKEIKLKKKILGSIIGVGILTKFLLNSIKKKNKIRKGTKIYILGSTLEGLFVAEKILSDYKVNPNDLYIVQNNKNKLEEEFLYCPLKDIHRDNTPSKLNSINILDGSKLAEFKGQNLDKEHKALVFKLSTTLRENLEGISVEDWFNSSPDFFNTDFWEVISNLKLIKKSSSAISLRDEVKNYLLSDLYFYKDVQLKDKDFEYLRTSIIKELDSKGVNFIFNTRVLEIEFSNNVIKKPISLIMENDRGIENIPLKDNSLVILTNASTTDNITIGSKDMPPEIDMSNPDSKTLWEELLKESNFGNPGDYLNNISETALYSFIFSMDRKTYEKISKNLKGKLLIKKSNWKITLEFSGEQNNRFFICGYGLEPFEKGNLISKTMRDSSGCEILQEVLGHLSIPFNKNDLNEVEITPFRIPYALADRLVTREKDLPDSNPKGFSNFLFISSFVKGRDSIDDVIVRSINSIDN